MHCQVQKRQNLDKSARPTKTEQESAAAQWVREQDDNLAVANLRSYPLSYSAASRNDSVKSLFQGHNSDMPCVSFNLYYSALLRD